MVIQLKLFVNIIKAAKYYTIIRVSESAYLLKIAQQTITFAIILMRKCD